MIIFSGFCLCGLEVIRVISICVDWSWGCLVWLGVRVVYLVSRYIVWGCLSGVGGLWW